MILLLAGITGLVLLTLAFLSGQYQKFVLPLSQTRYIEIVRRGLEEHPYRIEERKTVTRIAEAVRVVAAPKRPITWDAPDYRLSFVTAKGRVEMGYIPGQYVVVDGRVYLAGEDFDQALRPEIDQAETCFRRFGVPYPWSGSEMVFPLDSIATIVDFDTGKRFRAQFLAGDNHADCQTLTARDTEIYKEIYGGVWSWDRRAVVLFVGGRCLAASIIGKPHGAGSIPGNELPGHFCVHFLGSHTHTGNQLDPDHQRMVLKAAGKKGFRQEIDQPAANSNQSLSDR
jgi:hypothetical protein